MEVGPLPKGFSEDTSETKIDDSSAGIQVDKLTLVTLADYFQVFFTRYFLQSIVNITNM